jgi:hypothetical protein
MPAERRPGHVDDVVRGQIELAGGGANGHRLVDADLAGDDGQQRFADTEADARYRLLMVGTCAQFEPGWCFENGMCHCAAQRRSD